MTYNRSFYTWQSDQNGTSKRMRFLVASAGIWQKIQRFLIPVKQTQQETPARENTVSYSYVWFADTPLRWGYSSGYEFDSRQYDTTVNGTACGEEGYVLKRIRLSGLTHIWGVCFKQHSLYRHFRDQSLEGGGLCSGRGNGKVVPITNAFSHRFDTPIIGVHLHFR